MQPTLRLFVFPTPRCSPCGVKNGIAALVASLMFAACDTQASGRNDPLAAPALVSATERLVGLCETYVDLNAPHPGPAAVAALREAIHMGAEALKHASFRALDDPDDRRRLRAHLALQTLGVHPHELRELLGSPQTSSRLWALLSEDGFPMAKRPADVSEPLSDLEARAFVRRHATVVKRLLAFSQDELRQCNEDFRSHYEAELRGYLDEPHEHLDELFALRVDFNGDGTEDVVCAGRMDTYAYDFGFLLVVDGKDQSVLVEYRIEDTTHVVRPRCIDVDGDGRAEVLLSRWIGNPVNHYLHVFDAEQPDPVVFANRFVELIEDPQDGAVWFVETYPFNAFGGTSSMLSAVYGAEHTLTRLAPRGVHADERRVYTDVTAF